MFPLDSEFQSGDKKLSGVKNWWVEPRKLNLYVYVFHTFVIKFLGSWMVICILYFVMSIFGTEDSKNVREKSHRVDWWMVSNKLVKVSTQI